MADKNDAYYIEKALVEIEIIIGYTKGLSYEEFMSDGRNIDANLTQRKTMVKPSKFSWKTTIKNYKNY